MPKPIAVGKWYNQIDVERSELNHLLKCNGRVRCTEREWEVLGSFSDQLTNTPYRDNAVTALYHALVALRNYKPC